MKVHCVLLSITLSLCCSAQGDLDDRPPAAMSLGVAQSPTHSDVNPSGPNTGGPQLSQLVQDQQQDALWRQEVLDLLKQLVQAQKDVAVGQAKVVQLLGTLETQGFQLIQDLQNTARHQSLLVENHQALLLQTSRIASHLQEMSKKPEASDQ